MWCIRKCHKPGLVVRQGIFLSVNFHHRLSYGVRAAPWVQSHASTSVRMLKILNTSSYTTVWTQENTAHTSRSGQHSEALKVEFKKKKRTLSKKRSDTNRWCTLLLLMQGWWWRERGRFCLCVCVCVLSVCFTHSHIRGGDGKREKDFVCVCWVRVLHIKSYHHIY